MRRVLWVGAATAAAAARAVRHARRTRDGGRSNGQSLTVRATVAPELVADLTDLLGRVTGRAASDNAGAIRIELAPGIHSSDAERDLRAVLHRWSEMHPGIHLRISVEEERSRARRQAVLLPRRLEIRSASKNLPKET